MKLSILIKNKKVYVRLRSESEGIDRKFSVFDLSMHPGDLDVKAMAFKNPKSYHHKNFNNYIRELLWLLESFTLETVIDTIKNGPSTMPFALYFKRYHFLLTHGMLKGQLGFKSKSYIDSVGQAIAVYEEFVKEQKDLFVDYGSSAVTDHFYEFARYCREDRKLAISSQKTYFTHILTIANYMKKHGDFRGTIDLPIPKKAAKTVHTVPLSILSEYVNHTPTKGDLYVAHLVTIVQIFSCLRIGDVLNLTLNDLDDDTMGVKIRNQKNSTFTYAPLPESVYLKVRGWIRSNGTLTHNDLYDKRHSNRLRNYNAAIREVCRSIPSMHVMVDNVKQSSTGETTMESLLLCDVLTSHNFRKTGATMYRAFGLPDHIIKSMTGHSSGSTLLDTTYTRVDGHKDKIVKSWEGLTGLVQGSSQQ